MSELTTEQQEALEYARRLAENGIPIFVARSDSNHPTGFKIPYDWQATEPDPAVVSKWKPGMALCAVMGWGLDAIDIDPQKGGDESFQELVERDAVPRVYGAQSTPSGGKHLLVESLGVRSRDGVKDGLDIKAGLGEREHGYGHGFIFLAPTVKKSKVTGEKKAYAWIAPPDDLESTIVGGEDDEAGERLAAVVRQALRGKVDKVPGHIDYVGPEYPDLTAEQQAWADRWVVEKSEAWRLRFSDALGWPDGQTDEHGRGWEALSRDWAWVVANMAAAPWTALDEDSGEILYNDVIPIEIARDEKCMGKWFQGVVEKSARQGVPAPPWDGFTDIESPLDGAVRSMPDIPQHLDDARMADWILWKGLGGEWCWTSAMGWHHWDGRRWKHRSEDECKNAIRMAMISLNIEVLGQGLPIGQIRQFNGFLSAGKIGSIVGLMRGAAAVDAESFDAHPDLLNVGNGVVDLRTGELLPHDPSYRMTKITEVDYLPGVASPDWEKAQEALEPEVAEWMKVRFGQAITGYPTEDDLLTIGQGGGSNGKSSWINSIAAALGEHYTLVPEKLIRASPNDHPTELMTLKGARVAVVDETPEAASLNVARLKATVGQERITARAISKDNVTWVATHSLFVMTNYIPNITETDHGTWRRLALVKFEKTFARDEVFRIRLRSKGVREAVLVWLVEGAMAWYAEDRRFPEIPMKVVRDTEVWRKGTDMIMAYIDEHLEFEAGECVMATDLLDDFNEWIGEKGLNPWGERTFSQRFGQHQITNGRVEKKQTRDTSRLNLRHGGTPVPARPQVWLGVRWRTDDEDDLI